MDSSNEQLKTYVKDQLRAGFKPDEIVAHLQAAGWPENAIHDAFRSLQADMTPTTMSSQSPMADTAPHAATSKKGRIRTGWRLFRQSLTILRGNKRLARFPVMAAIWSIIGSLAVVLGLFFVAVVGHNLFAHNDAAARITVYGYFIVLYAVIYFIANLYAAGLSVSVLAIFRGERPTYRDAMHAAWSKAPALLRYSLIESTLGLLLRLIIERFRFVGWIIARLFGAIWSLGTMFVVPIIVTDDQPQAIGSIKRSFGLFKKTWGEGIVSKASVGVAVFFLELGLIFGGLIVGGLAIFGAGSLFGDTGAAVMGVIVLVAFLVALVGLAIFGTLASSIVNVALFYYATTGQVPPAFDAALLNSVFIARKRRFFGKKSNQ